MIKQNMLCDIFNAYLYDNDDNLIFMSENLTSSDIKGSADEVEVRNGRGNSLFAKLYHNKKIDVSLKTNTFNFSMLSMLCSSPIGTGDGTCYAEAQLLKVTAGKFTLEETPLHPTKVNMFAGDEKIVATFNGKEATVDTKYNDKEVKIMPYEYSSVGDEVQEILVEADKFPEACKLVLKGVVKDQKTKVYSTLTIEIPQASVSSDFSLATSSEVKPTETEIKLSALTDNGRLMKITQIPLSTGQVIKAISDLTGIGGALKVNLLFTAIGNGATNIIVKYKKTTNKVFSDVANTGTSGVYMASALTDTSTSAEILGLEASTSYDFKIVYDIGVNTYESNITTEKTTA